MRPKHFQARVATWRQQEHKQSGIGTKEGCFMNRTLCRPLTLFVPVPALVFMLFIGLTQGLAQDDLPKKVLLTGRSPTSEECGTCHLTIYREYAMGFGADLRYREVVSRSPQDKLLDVPANVSTTGTHHSTAALDPFPVHARNEESGDGSCKACHFPRTFAIPELDRQDMGKPEPRPEQDEHGGVRCISCHLTPEGAIRTPHKVQAPHETIQDARIHTSAMCAYCHSLGPYSPGKQTQTFLEWREDFHKPDLGKQHCQDCHMPRTLRKTAETFDVPVRPVARHLWAGGHSTQRVQNAATAVIVQPSAGQPRFEFHIINVGAGHSIPSGSNRRGLYLVAEVEDQEERIVASREWLFAPWYGDRSDDRGFVEEDRRRPDSFAAIQADLQGPHESILRAGENRIISWNPTLKPGSYTARARLIYDLNRYNDWTLSQDQTEAMNASLAFQILGP
jgi:hypothetical protein